MAETGRATRQQGVPVRTDHSVFKDCQMSSFFGDITVSMVAMSTTPNRGEKTSTHRPVLHWSRRLVDRGA